MDPFQPACADLSVFPGDTFDLELRVFTDGGGGARQPFQMSPGEVFSLTFGRTVCTTADAGAGRLLTVVNANGTRFLRQFTPIETGRLAQSGAPLLWAFARVPTPGSRRTYAHGALQLVSATACGVGDRIIDLTVSEGGVIVDLGGVPDAASYTDAREAAIRADQAVINQQIKIRSYAAALLF